MTDVCSEIRIKPTNTICVQNANILKFKPVSESKKTRLYGVTGQSVFYLHALREQAATFKNE